MTEPTPTTAVETLDHAKHIITGDRRGTHGDPERCFDTIATMWTAYLSAGARSEVHVRPADVCRMMALLKVARAGHGNSADHDVDMVGYGALALEMEAKNREKTQ